MLNTLIKQPMAGSVYGQATSTTHAVYAIPASWVCGKIVLQAITANMFVLFGTADTVEVSTSGVSTYSSPPALVVGSTTGVYIPAGTAIEFQLESGTTHFAIEADNTGAWRGWRSDV